jgi:hypothetical protein
MDKTPHIEITSEDEARFRAIDAIFTQLVSGCSEDEFRELRCPVCGDSLTLNVHPKLHSFFVRCVSSSVHLGRHGEIVEAPSWWQSRVTGGWLS